MNNFASSRSYETFAESSFAEGQAVDPYSIEWQTMGIFADVEYGCGTHLPVVHDGNFATGQNAFSTSF